MRTIKLWMLGIFGSLYVGSLVLFAVGFVAVWREGGWLSYWAGFLSVGPIGFGVAKVALWRDARADLFAPVARLRQAIRAGDETIAPVVATSTVGSVDVAADSSRLGPLRRPAATGTVATLWGIALLALLVPFFGIPSALGAGNGYLALLLAAVGLPLALVCILLGRRSLSPLFVRIDHDGLRWRRPLGLMAFAAWRDATSYFSLTYPTPLPSDRNTLYVLDCATVMLAWRASAATESDAPPLPWRVGAAIKSNAPSLHSPSLQLSRLITEYMGLPLRDVTAQAKTIAGPPVVEVVPTARGVSMQVRASGPSKEEVRHRLRVAAVVLSPFLLLALVSLVAMLVQAPYYEHLCVQAHAHAALYRDALTHADGDWPDSPFAHFEQGVYHFQQVENQTSPTYVVAPHHYDRALVEVSGRTGGTTTLGGVGLAITSPSRSTVLLTFRVAPDGTWWIERLSTMEPYYDFKANNSTRLGDMSAIRRGFGVWNQIAVLVNGSDFTFYVNGHFATGYHDDALQGGEVGPYLDITSDSGDFSRFAVYPL